MTPLDVLREALKAADAYDCGCDDPGNPSRCINTGRFAALDEVEALVEAARHSRAVAFPKRPTGFKRIAARELEAALAPFQAHTGDDLIGKAIENSWLEPDE